MVRFVQGTPVRMPESSVAVHAGLPVGTHRFRLVVIDSGGRSSRPAEVEVIVRRDISEPIPIGPAPSTETIRSVQPIAEPTTVAATQTVELAPSRRRTPRQKKNSARKPKPPA